MPLLINYKSKTENMKKKITFGTLMFPLLFCAQVGINNNVPASTLDITAKNATGTSAVVEGLLIPRVDRQKAQSMASVPVSTLIYVNSIATGTQTGSTVNVDAVGYYYFNGTVWTKLNPSVNIYNSDGTLTGNRTMTQDANTLAFTGTATNAFSVDGTTLSVDAANDRVGVGTTTPQKTQHVNGSLQVVNELNVGGTASTAGSAGTSGQILTSGGAGAATSWRNLNTLSGALFNTYYVQGTSEVNVAQGTTVDIPGVTLTVTVPAGYTQTFMFNIVGYANQTTSGASQGVFILLQNGVKISSAFASSSDGSGLTRLPNPVTLLKSVTLTAGTYTFKVQYDAWSANQAVNYVPSIYAGYNGDVEAMLTKMQVLVYNH